MADLNSPTSVIYTADNLKVLRGLNSGSVDLIYADPPFNTGKQWHNPIGKDGDTVGFNDIWGWDRVTGETLEETIARQWEEERDYAGSAVREVVEAALAAHSPQMGSYCAWMAPRLIEIHRDLSDTGSFYLHCDSFASHYLKALLDAIFGTQQFRNHVIWRRATAHNDPRRFGRNVDHILYYVKGRKGWTWNGRDIATPKSEEDIDRAYPMTDERGRFRNSDLTGPRHGTGPGVPSTSPWREYDVYARGRCWSPPKTGAYAEHIERHFIPGYRSIKGVQERLDALDAAGLINHPISGVWPGLKRYAASEMGNPAQSLILEPTGFTNYNKGSGERTGYPTQKPLALLERIIKASSNEGDVVLDPFCGCATACVAAQKLGRRWIGIDVEPKAVELCRGRLQNELGFEGITQELTKPPERTEQRQLELIPHNRAVRLDLWRKMQEKLQVENPACPACDRAPGIDYMEVDHIVPRSRGGEHTWSNVQLLCGPCNRSKGNKAWGSWRREAVGGRR